MTEHELKDYTDTRIGDMLRMVDAKELASKDRALSNREYIAQHQELTARALDKAEVAIAGRLEAMNQFREQLQHERGLYLTRELWDEKHTLIAQRLEGLERFNLSLITREVWDSQQTATHLRLEVLEKRNATQDGKFIALGIMLTVLMFIISLSSSWLSK